MLAQGVWKINDWILLVTPQHPAPPVPAPWPPAVPAVWTLTLFPFPSASPPFLLTIGGWGGGGGGLIHGRKKLEDWGVAIGEFQFVPKQTNERIGGGVSDRRVSTRPQKN